MADYIVINKLELSIRIGCSAEERVQTQKVELDARIEVSAKEAASSKELKDTVCYLTLSNLYCETAEQREWVLIEELLESLASLTLSKYSAVRKISLEARKFVVPRTDSVGVGIERFAQ